MNKKLFSWKALAGFALLAAISFTSCQADKAIDSSNPNGVTPTAVKHSVGGDYDWTVAASNVTEFNKFWTEDAAKVQALVAKKGTASINIIADNFELNNTAIDIPELWVGGANGKVVNVVVTGKFKKVDFERAEAMKATPAKFPVKIDTKNVKGAEVNFTFDAEEFDLELATKLTRSTLNGAFLIGYFYFDGAQNLSAVEVKDGIVSAIDLASSGDVIENGGDVLGAWFKGNYGQKADGTPRRETDIWKKEKGIGLGDNQKVIVTNLAVEKDIQLTGNVKDANKKITKLDNIVIVNTANTIVTLPKESYVTKITGVKEANNFVKIANATDLNNIEEIEKVTIDGAAVDLTISKDIFTDVTFKTKSVAFSVDKLNTIDKVTFDKTSALTISVKADDQTLTFNGVNFNVRPTLVSENTTKIESDDVDYAGGYYQWVIDATDPTKGSWKTYNPKADPSEIKTYNAGKDEYTFVNAVAYNGANAADVVAYIDANGQLKAGGKASDEDKANIAAAKYLIKIGKFVKAGTVTLIPENFNIVLDKDCKFNDKTTDLELNNIWGNKTQIASAGSAISAAVATDQIAWYSVTYNDVAYKWVPTMDGKGAFAEYVLLKNE